MLASVSKSFSMQELKQIVIAQMVPELVSDQISWQELKNMPHELAQQLVNMPLCGKKDTLAHFCAQKALTFKNDKSNYLHWLEKLQILLDVGFNNVNSHDTFPLSHMLVQLKPSRRTLDLLWAVIKRGACVNAAYDGRNLFDTAILTNNLPVVEMLTKETNAIPNIEETPYPMKSLIREINTYKDKNPLFAYLAVNLERYKQKYIARNVLAPCCPMGHALYTPYNPMALF